MKNTLNMTSKAKDTRFFERLGTWIMAIVALIMLVLFIESITAADVTPTPTPTPYIDGRTVVIPRPVRLTRSQVEMRIRRLTEKRGRLIKELARVNEERQALFQLLSAMPTDTPSPTPTATPGR